MSKNKKEKSIVDIADSAVKEVKKANKNLNDAIKVGKNIYDALNIGKGLEGVINISKGAANILSDFTEVLSKANTASKGSSEETTKINNGIINLINELTDDYFQAFQVLCSEAIVFNRLGADSISKDAYIEKVLDYIETYHIKNNVNYKDVLQTYVNYLLPAISDVAKKDTREEKYLNKAKAFAKELKNDSKYDFEKAKDFTRIFVSLYVLKDGKGEFDFELSGEKLSKTIERLQNTKSYKALFKNGGTMSDFNIKYHKMVFVDMLLELLYLNMLSKRSESELD